MAMKKGGYEFCRGYEFCPSLVAWSVVRVQYRAGRVAQSGNTDHPSLNNPNVKAAWKDANRELAAANPSLECRRVYGLVIESTDRLSPGTHLFVAR